MHEEKELHALCSHHPKKNLMDDNIFCVIYWIREEDNACDH
jgi:hypothetical protein